MLPTHTTVSIAFDKRAANTKALAGLAALAVAIGIGRFAFTPMLPMMLDDGTLDMHSGAWLASANYLGYLIGALSALVLPFRPERVIRSGLLTICAVTLAMAMALPFTVWLLLRLVAGIASAWVLISVSAWCLASLAPYRRPSLNGWVFAGVGVGIATAGLFCFVLTKYHADSVSAWLTLGLSATITSILIWPFFAPQPAHANKTAHSVDKPFGWNADALRLTCCYGIYGFCYIIPATFLPLMAKTMLHNAAIFGLSWPVFGLAASISTLCVGYLVSRIGNRRVWMLSQWIMAIGIVLPILSPQLLTVFIAAICVGGSFMVITLVAMQEARQVAGADPRPLIATMTAAFAAGQIAGPLTVSGNAGFSSSLIVAAALLIISTLLLRRTRIDSAVTF